MGVSFKVARVGTRYKPKLVPIEDKASENASKNDSQQRSVEGNLSQIGAEIVDDLNKKHKNVLHSTLEELEVSFSLNLFKDGFSIGKGIEFLSDIPNQLLPYDKASETLFSAVEYGWLPGDLLDDIPCKYVNGALMCEIRDYRDIFPYKEGHPSPTGNSPIVHKMILKLCMETVVKDILSISNGSWTYKDLLEVESCIIKALQPDLHLNPEPLGDKFFCEPPRKKLDLGIAWGWKKRKLSDGPTQGLPVRNSNLVKYALGDCLTQKSKPQSGPLEKDTSTSSMQENISGHFCNPQGINSALDYTSPSYALVVLETPSFVSVPNQLPTNVNTIAPENLVPSENSICDKQSIKGLPYKKPKQEPVDLPKLQLLGSQVNIVPQGPELQWVDNALQEQVEVDKILCENKKGKLHFPQLTHDGQMVLRGIQNQHIRAPSVKQEPAETSGLHTDDICMDISSDTSNLHNSKQQFSSKPLSINSSSAHSFNHMGQPSDRCLKNGNATQKRKISQNSQVTAADGSLSTTSRNSKSLQRQAPIKTGHKNSRSRGLKTEMADSVVSLSSRNVTNANSLTVKNFCPPQPSVEVNIAADRLLKIMSVSERYGLVNKKRKLDQFTGKKPSFCRTPPLVGLHLASFEDSGKSEYSTGYKLSSSKYSNYWKTRTLIFSHESHIIQRSDCPVVDCEAQVKLVMLDNLDLGTVEARVYYGCEGEHLVSFSLLPTFPSSLHSVNRLASQFTSLMVREGYHIISDQVGFSPCNKDGESGIEKQPIVSNAILTYGTVKPSATWTAGLSFPPLQNSSIRMPFHVATHSPQQNILSGVNFAVSGNSLSLPQPTHSSLSKLQLDNLQQQMRSMQQWWQQGANKFSWLQYQMQLLRHGQEQELLPRTESTVDLSATTSGQDTVPLNDGIQRIRNIEPSSCSHIKGNNASGPIFSGGLVNWLNSLSTCNSLENNHISGLNDKQLFGALSDDRLAALPKLNTSQNRGLICGLPTQGNASMLAIAKADAIDMRNMFNNHREPRAETSQQSCIVQQQEIRSISADQAGSPLPLVTLLHDQLPQLGTQQLNPITMPTLQQMNYGSISGSGNPEVSFWTHGSVGSSKT